MKPSVTITVTGATGKIGRILTERLLKNGAAVRAVARNAENLALLSAKGAKANVVSFDDIALLTEAFRGADAAFVILPGSPPNTPDYLADQARLTTNLVQAIKASDIERVVALSAQGSGLRYGSVASLTRLEESLQSINGLSVVALRSCYHMTNFLRTIPLIKRAGINAGAIHADLPMPMIAARDVAGVAAEYLMAPNFSGYQTRDLLGAREYTHREATSILGTAIGKPDLPYIEWSYEEYQKNLLEMGFSASAADTLTKTWVAVNDGPGSTHPLRNASNTTSTTLEEFVQDTFVHVYQAS
jgi:uncharacterized protein YbjT (DUF2867 family)